METEMQLRGFQLLCQNPFYLYLLARLAMDEAAATNLVFQGDSERTNEHFIAVGKALGLVRMKELLLGKVADLKTQLKDENTETMQ